MKETIDAVYNIVNHNKDIPEVPNKEKYNLMIPVLPDLHILHKEPSNRTNFMITTLSYLLNLAEIFEKNRIKYAVQAGDLYDRGYSNIDTSDGNIVEVALKNIKNKLKEFYIVYGNHEHTYSKDNLFFSYTDIQSSTLDKIIEGKKILKVTNPIFKAVDKLELGDINLNFMHFDPNKNYTISPEGFNVCIFHDDLISFDSKVELYHHKIGHGISITDTDILENVDIAICAHIHTPLLPFRLNNKRKTLVITPGSLCQRTVAETHKYVDIPVICLNEEGVNMEYIKFNLGEIDETVVEDIAVKQKKLRESNKSLKQFTRVYGNVHDLEDLINSLPKEQSNIIRNSDKKLFPISLQRFHEKQG